MLTLILKFDTSKESKNKEYYFSDHSGANMSDNMTYKQAMKQVQFLKSVGITVEDRSF
jgi:hypothetical protein